MGKSHSKQKSNYQKNDSVPTVENRECLDNPAIHIEHSNNTDPSNNTDHPSHSIPETVIEKHITQLAQPYFINKQGEIKKPYHLITWWRLIMAYLGPNERDTLLLRWSCRLFKDSLPNATQIIFTTFPSRKHKNLRTFLEFVNSHPYNRPRPTVIFIQSGTHTIQNQTVVKTSNRITLDRSITICGENQHNTIIQGGFRITGQATRNIGIRGQEQVKFYNLTVRNSTDDGIFAWKGLDVHVENCIIEHSLWNGIGATSSVVTVKNCQVRNNQKSGIFAQTQIGERPARITLQGRSMKVSNNCTSKKKMISMASYGIECWKNSTISMDSSLQRNLISINNKGGGNVGGCLAFRKEMELLEMDQKIDLTKQQQQPQRQYLSKATKLKIANLNGNNECCDCNSRSDVTWASVSHGTMLCIQCAGLHRNFGVEISFIKSLSLDFWTSEQITSMLISDGNDAFLTYMKDSNNEHWQVYPRLRNIKRSQYTTVECATYRNDLKRRVAFKKEMDGIRNHVYETIWRNDLEGIKEVQETKETKETKSNNESDTPTQMNTEDKKEGFTKIDFDLDDDVYDDGVYDLNEYRRCI